MLNVTLQYSEALIDGKNFFNTLAKQNIHILKTTKSHSTEPKVVIRIQNYEELNRLLLELNKNCTFTVSVIKVRSDDTVICRVKERLKRN